MHKRYAIVGTGSRAGLFIRALSKEYRNKHNLVALCDINKVRMQFHNRTIVEKYNRDALPMYKASDFDLMIREQKIDGVIVTTRDDLHHKYIIRAMELGCDVISEKPMTTDEEKCQAILDTIKKTGKNLRVTFNYRYSPARTKLKELLMNDIVGSIQAVHFEWMLDTSHGADYYRRWHRNKKHSGSLLVHKATHHFDLVNWWLNSVPSRVFAFGKLGFYGDKEKRHSDRCSTCNETESCPFVLKLEKHKGLTELYLKAEQEDGYYRDQCVFGEGIDIYDTMNVMVRYKNETTMSYTLNSFSPYEGYKIGFMGTRGRVQLDELEMSYISGAEGEIKKSANPNGAKITVHPHFKPSYEVGFGEAQGDHGGGDVRLLKDIFDPDSQHDPFGRAANSTDGAYSILTGIAARKSIETGLPIDVSSLVNF